MVSVGYFLSCEEFGPHELVRQARLAEQAGFERLWISDHYHPWLREQGQSPFVWSVIGALSQVTSLQISTAVTCPIIRIHPAIIAQAAATASVPGRPPRGTPGRSVTASAVRCPAVSWCGHSGTPVAATSPRRSA